MATYARGLTSQAVNLTHTTHWSECLMYYVANACSNRNLCNWRVYQGSSETVFGREEGGRDWWTFGGVTKLLSEGFPSDVVEKIQ